MAEEPDAAAFFSSSLPTVEEITLPPDQEFAWTAFWCLNGDRQMYSQGFGAPMGATIIEPIPGRIPFSAVDGYAHRFGIYGSAFDHLLYLVGELDQEYLAISAERSRDRWEKMRAK